MSLEAKNLPETIPGDFEVGRGKEADLTPLGRSRLGLQVPVGPSSSG
jgi:hypothetical protein